MTDHTKLPWNVRDHKTQHGGRHIWIEGGEPIGQTRAGPYKRQILEDEDYDEKAADAAFIVKATNHHYDLVDCVRASLNMVDGDGAPPDWDLLRRTLKSAEARNG